MSAAQATPSDSTTPRILETVKRYWGYDSLRPLQTEAIRAGLDHRDSLVVLPTGGGKSLCYQVPAMLANRTDIVVSPLISLMKDQVDGLNSNGYPAAALHSGLSDRERRDIELGVSQNKYRLIFVAPERLLTSSFMQIIARLEVKAFNIDEAHCISQWGHDFRPEYRQLATLKQRFPRASVHAYTATATPRVREDIVNQLQLKDANVLVGIFDRPNLTYRIVPKVDVQSQVIEVARRHHGEAAIVYCISRKDTESMAEVLKANNIKAAAYHAGMEKEDRSRVQEAFAEEELDIVVATVAFGMGIDRSNVRCVMHAAMPKTVEHYQQETGRAGRDGLEAECIMFYSAGDFIRWDSLIGHSAQKIESDELREATVASQLELLEHMRKLCSSVRCRHGALSRYFGQEYLKANCGACDICLNEVESMSHSTVIAQKILSCVARLQQKFGMTHVMDVLLGANTEQVRSFGHDSQSTYGLLKEIPKNSLRNLVYQLIDQQLLERTPGDRPILKLNDESVAVLKGRREVQLIEPAAGPVRKSKVEETSWEGVDRELFERLREVRKRFATERAVPAFVILSDNTLRELARVRPSNLQLLRKVRGIGDQKLADFGQGLLETIQQYCQSRPVNMDVQDNSRIAMPESRSGYNAIKERAFTMFAQGVSVADVAAAIGRALSTTGQYLEEFVKRDQIKDVSPWVDDNTYARIKHAAMGLEQRRAKPIFDSLNAEVPYEAIRVVMAHMEVAAGS